MTGSDTTAAAPINLAIDRARNRRWPVRLRKILAPFAVVIALVSAFLTFVVLTGLTPISPTHSVVITFLMINAAAILLLVAIIVRELWVVVQARRRGRAAARLHIQIAALFSVIAVLPAVLVAIVANITLDRGLDRLFSTRTKAVIENSLIVANAYLHEHGKLIRGDILGMASELTRARILFDQDRVSFQEILNQQAASRNLPGAMLIDRNRNILVSAETGIKQSFQTPASEFLQGVNATDPQIAVFIEQNYVAAVVRLQSFDNLYLYVARLLEPRVVAQLRETQASVAEFAQLETRRLGIQVAFGLMFGVIALIVLLSAVLIGMNFANWLVAPIRRLIGAADSVASGNLDIQVPVVRAEGDLAHLGETFNKMTQELRTQRDDLVSASELIDTRRQFTEAVLAAASAGIIGVDEKGDISILNRSAEKLIGHPQSEALGHRLSDIVPELSELMDGARQGYQRLIQGQVTLEREGRERNLSVRVTTQHADATGDSFIITLDDITDLVAAQRTSAWGDVARRIAHEIKNPLTPIQLSAERIRRKYGKQIVEDRAIFDQCTDTIVRQVDDIRRMVDEFSRFARMPKPVIEGEDVADMVRQTVFLMRVGYPDIDMEAEIAEDPMPAKFDRRLISQALTNIIKNATEAIAAVPPEELGRGRIDVSAQRIGGDIVIDVIDNGIGLPKESRSRLLEPYVTTREKGTGLGLAIVGRVLEDHGGKIELNDASSNKPGQRGAWLRLRFAAEGPISTNTRTETPPLTASS
jgi:two-component system nitrogen regulation sensor histidine kinase NtrY